MFKTYDRNNEFLSAIGGTPGNSSQPLAARKPAYVADPDVLSAMDKVCQLGFSAVAGVFQAAKAQTYSTSCKPGDAHDGSGAMPVSSYSASLDAAGSGAATPSVDAPAANASSWSVKSDPAAASGGTSFSATSSLSRLATSPEASGTDTGDGVSSPGTTAPSTGAGTGAGAPGGTGSLDGGASPVPGGAGSSAGGAPSSGPGTTAPNAGPTPDINTEAGGGSTPQANAAATPNKIALENMKQGNPQSEWGIDGDGDPSIQGFATEISTNIGGTVDFKIATDSTNYRIEIYRLGYYGGDGARRVDTIDIDLATAQVQPHPIVDMSIGLIDCGNWGVSASWQIPQDAVSGVYVAKLIREDGSEGASHIPFIVRDDNSTSDIVFQTSDTTWQAYNAWGGASLYYGEVPMNPEDMIAYMPPNCSCGVTAIGRAYAVSYNRPFITNSSPWGGTHDFIFGAEHSAIRWLEQNGYDVSYISGVDATRSGNLLLNHQAYLSVGHDEYWSAEQRANVEAARDAGVNLAFWSGNECYWKVRWETSIDGNGTPYRTMVCYKETWAGVSIDPSDTTTGTWRDPRFREPGQEPENSLTGTMFTVDSYRLDTITIPYDYSNLRFWRNTDVAELQPGETHSLVQNLLGYEWDSDVENGFRPAGLINMSLSTVSVNTYLRDYGTTIGSADATHSLTMYRAESGALVFGAGTVFWSWGLDAEHEGAETPTDRNVQQAMVNMFADMGIQPTTLDASLILASQSTDAAKPTSTITSPIFGASFVEGQRVTITGTAVDFGGGVIAGVEVSTDGGQSWFKATGRENWTYSWIAQASATYTIMSRAVDDSLNLETPGTGKQVTVSLPETASLWTFASKPAEETVLDRDPVEVGVRFQTTIAGTVEGIKFYKGFYNIGAHKVSLWTADGTLLATGTSTGESLSGWQTVTFSSPVHIVAGTTYIASYHTGGFYSTTQGYFSNAYANGPLRVQQNGGVYAYGSTSTFPGNSSTENYWVDVVFNAGPNTVPVATDDSGYSVFKDALIAIPISSLIANDMDPDGDALTISAVGNAVNGTVTLNTQTGNVIFTPNAGYIGPASFTYTLSDGRGGTDQATVSLNVQQGPEGVSLFNPTDGPTGPGSNDNNALELGMKFTVSASGTITGMRFYKVSGDTGPHTGSIWSATGSLLATVTFTSETPSGWQTAIFSNPIQVTAGTTYVASYHTTGAYAATKNFFEQTYTNGPISAPSSTISGGNGVYAYSATSVFPTSSYQATNYWVDVVFKQSTGSSAPIANNDNGFTVTRDGILSLSSAMLLANDTDADGDQLTITGVGNATNGTVSLNSQTGLISFTPTGGYTGPASFTYTISDGHGGTDSATVSLTVTPPSNAVGLFAPNATPSVAAVNDPGSVELGVRFTVSASGMITGLRYYKSAQDTGTHTGSLWTSTGTLLARATFTNETASGWQTVTFAEPIAVTAGTSYVASYHSNGFYAASPNYFTSTHTNGPLSAPAGANGVYAYGSTSVFPSSSYNSTNYWVDVLYEQSSQNIAPIANNDSGFSSTYNTPLVFQASSLLANDNDPNGDPLVITGVGGAVNGTVAFDSQTNAVTFTPTANHVGGASFSYTISDGRGGTASAQVSLTVSPPDAEQNLFTASDTPTTVTANDPNSVNLGMKFQADVAGWITGFRFYKGPQNTGPHEAHLWTANGTLLASATFTNETASGWQTVRLDEEVAIEANTTYVVSYHTNGFYSMTTNYFGAEHSNNNLHALADGLSGGNGVFAYGDSGLFPTSSFNKSNYYVDVAFRPQLAA
ncbi:DUF4082 domain-containing protein [Aquamicrobium sp. LC103]|uniref:DUF4082 domain-containing protein n=1 Tax=Aquamicrobium sp. LC103 TaxID=1120658 RepID=UPI0009E55234|nr:DUF4082 domain-containing protein [Aquamicrobium sp. LC103]TKT75043.1 DUF4082 domain-containing protein [Aquamicrobium sp. LC103]